MGASDHLGRLVAIMGSDLYTGGDVYRLHADSQNKIIKDLKADLEEFKDLERHCKNLIYGNDTPVEDGPEGWTYADEALHHIKIWVDGRKRAKEIEERVNQTTSTLQP